MRTALRRMGNSTGMIVPRALLRELGLAAGSPMDLHIEGGRIVAAPADSDESGERLTAEERRALSAFAAELRASTERMNIALDRAVASLREANDPARDDVFRRRARVALDNRPLDFTLDDLAA